MGWPPVRSYRKNILSVQKRSKEDDKASFGVSFVKVSMDGEPYLRKVTETSRDVSHPHSSTRAYPMSQEPFPVQSDLMSNPAEAPVQLLLATVVVTSRGDERDVLPTPTPIRANPESEEPNPVHNDTASNPAETSIPLLPVTLVVTSSRNQQRLEHAGISSEVVGGNVLAKDTTLNMGEKGLSKESDPSSLPSPPSPKVCDIQSMSDFVGISNPVSVATYSVKADTKGMPDPTHMASHADLVTQVVHTVQPSLVLHQVLGEVEHNAGFDHSQSEARVLQQRVRELLGSLQKCEEQLKNRDARLESADSATRILQHRVDVLESMAKWRYDQVEHNRRNINNSQKQLGEMQTREFQLIVNMESQRTELASVRGNYQALLQRFRELVGRDPTPWEGGA